MLISARSKRPFWPARRGATPSILAADRSAAVCCGLYSTAADPNGPSLNPAFGYQNAVVTDGIDFEGCTVSAPLLVSGVRIMDGPRGAFLLRDARLKQLSMQDCHVEGSLVADSAQVENGVLIAGGRIEGQILARGAQLGGALAIEGTQVGDGRKALTGSGLRLSGPLILRRTQLKGDVKLARCQLNAGIYAENTTIDGNSCGFDAESAPIDGDFLPLTRGFLRAYAWLMHGCWGAWKPPVSQSVPPKRQSRPGA